ncbi:MULTISPECIES: hypothetical protein [Serratia]|uniref:hypothetical protein n=1 Tax=Serratia TaxID=613 RepID=UPI00217D197D|nr:hypothetical protein [Serratia marcescens]
MAIKHNTKYLFMRNDGIWLFQVFVPSYMRHLTDGKRIFRRSNGERDTEKAINFRDHMIIEFNKIKNQLKPDTHQLKIQRGIAALLRSDKRAGQQTTISMRPNHPFHLHLLKSGTSTYPNIRISGNEPLSLRPCLALTCSLSPWMSPMFP